MDLGFCVLLMVKRISEFSRRTWSKGEEHLPFLMVWCTFVISLHDGGGGGDDDGVSDDAAGHTIILIALLSSKVRRLLGVRRRPWHGKSTCCVRFSFSYDLTCEIFWFMAWIGTQTATDTRAACGKVWDMELACELLLWWWCGHDHDD